MRSVAQDFPNDESPASSESRPDPMSHDDLETLQRTRLLVLDVDGTLTDGRIVYPGKAQEVQRFDVRDGQGLRFLIDAGLTVAWITGRGCDATERRARELGVQELVLCSGPKRAALAKLQVKLGISNEETVAMGDDLPDLGLAAGAAYFAAPADAVEAVRAAAQLVTRAKAGRGAVRELVDAILEAKGLHDSLIDAARA